MTWSWASFLLGVVVGANILGGTLLWIYTIPPRDESAQ